MKKKAQVTMFIIMGVLIVVLILFFLFFKAKLKPEVTEKTNFDVNTFMDLCLEDTLSESLNVISLNGGYIQPNLSINYDGKNVAYLCYNINNYQRCINQEPLLLKHLENEIHDYIEEDLKDCLEELETSLEKEDVQTDIDTEEIGYSIELSEGRVIVNIEKNFEFETKGEKRNIEGLKVVKLSKFFDIAIVVQEIVSQESWFCNFEQTGYMVLYPQFDIEKFRGGDSSTIYSVKHKETNEKFIFALRGCAIPPGIG